MTEPSHFEQSKTVAGELNLKFMPSGSQEAASAKAAVDAYMQLEWIGFINDAFFHQGKVPGEFPSVDLKADVPTGSPLLILVKRWET